MVEYDYDWPAETYKRFAGRGEVVIYLDEHGYDHERKVCEELGIAKGDEVTVTSVDVGSWSSTYTLEEYPGKHFNTVMFARQHLTKK